MTDAEQFAQDIIALHQHAHQQLRDEIAGLDSAALNWMPGPDTSSIAVIVIHSLGAEAEMLRNLLDIPTNRVRDEEFAARRHQPDELEKLIAEAEADWRELAPRLGERELRRAIPRPNKPEPQTGLHWLVRNYGHMREHIGQIGLTRQLAAKLDPSEPRA
jgi:hypothetical protein